MMARGFAFLLIGQFVTTLGNQVQDVAMMLWLKDLTGSASLMGLAMLLSNLPEAVLAPLGGRLADRSGRVRTLIVAELLAAAAVVVTLTTALAGGSSAVMVAVLFLGNLVVGISAAASGPASTSLVPDLVSTDRLRKANAAHQFAGTAARLAGQGLAGVLYGGFGAVWALILNALSFLLSAASAGLIREPARPAAPIGGGLFRDTLRVLRGVLVRPPLRRLFAFLMVFHLCLSVLPVTLPFHAQHALGLSSLWTGFLIAAYTGGILLGFAGAGLWPEGRGLRAIAGAGLGVGAAFVILAAAGMVWLAVAALVAIGAGIGFIIVAVITDLQTHAATDERGATMGAAQAVGGTSLPVGMALTGVALDAATGAGLAPATATFGLLCAAGVMAAGLALYALVASRRR